MLEREFKVKRSDGSEITDFDSIERTPEGELWQIEEKSASWAGDVNAWAQKQIFEKGQRYVDAIQNGVNLANPSKNIGFRFTNEINDPALQTAVENSVQQLQKQYPDYNFDLFIPK